MARMVFGNWASSEYAGRPTTHLKVPGTSRIGRVVRAACGRNVNVANVGANLQLATCKQCTTNWTRFLAQAQDMNLAVLDEGSN